MSRVERLVLRAGDEQLLRQCSRSSSIVAGLRRGQHGTWPVTRIGAGS